MSTRNYLTLEKAREWYNSGDATRKRIALQDFSKEELAPNFRNIKTFDNACKVIGIYYSDEDIEKIEQMISRASVAMFKLNIIRKALNVGKDLHLTKDPEDSYIWYPLNAFVITNTSFYKTKIDDNKVEVIGKIKSEGTTYYVLGNYAGAGGYSGLSNFIPFDGISHADNATGFLGCANKKIAEHFSKYFGMLITEAKYGDMVDFEIIEELY